MTPWVRATAWLVFWATLLVALLLGAFVAWLLTEVLPPGTVITIDGERFVLSAFTHWGQWLAAGIGVVLAALVIVILLPIVVGLALLVPVAVGSLGLLVGLGVPLLMLWALFLLGRRLWMAWRKPRTIGA